jgi:hypothetical protein
MRMIAGMQDKKEPTGIGIPPFRHPSIVEVDPHSDNTLVAVVVVLEGTSHVILDHHNALDVCHL